MKIQIYFLNFILCFTNLIIAQNNDKDEDERKSIDSLTIGLTKKKGIITSYQKEDKIFFEIDNDLLSKDLLMVTRFVKFPANFQAYQNAGSKASEQLIHFTKKNKQLLIIQKSYINIADKKDPIAKSVAQNNFPPILAAFPIKNNEKDRFLIDVSKYFNNDSPGFNILSAAQKKQFGIGSIDAKRSFIDEVKSFKENIEIRHTLTYRSSKAPKDNSTKTVSFQINHSIILLPAELMPIRYLDPRVGWFNLKKYNYSSEELKSDEIRVIQRWRIEPKDLDAYTQGELVEPVKPIVYYIDPATPIKWRPYFKKGIEDWAKVFEKAGFKNAIIAKDAPSEEEDPNFSLEDVRYSSIRYVATTTRNATGPRVSDPRTGEIIESDIIWYHNHLRSYRNRYLLETGAANPKARTLDTPEGEIGEMIRRVISHEVGHALGLPHNMKASSAYPVDSLRSGSFTQKNGIATTIMDYARYNYVAQPGDENIRFVRQLGPYDDYSIEWGYRFFPMETSETEKVSLNKMVDKKSMNPLYMFGSGGNDPNTQTENIGDDPIKASYYGINNLKIVVSNLDDWTTKKGQSYEDLNELYNETIGVYRRYIYHVIKMIGGINETVMVKGQDNVPYQSLNAKEQKRALGYLGQNLWQTQSWLMNPNLISKIKSKGILKVLQNLQFSALNQILSIRRLNRMISAENTIIGDGLSPETLIEKLFHTFFKENMPLDDSVMALQIRFAERVKKLGNENELNPKLKSTMLAFQKLIYKTAKKKTKIGKVSEKNHYLYLTKISEIP
ncbi:zinc-dependent metalloprotease [Flavobacteriaceae bacterium]|nr:zinc-dependent metalloprotease [Flavobacteriaceae bacterium]MDA9648433.1 zinc-dependent metalloprotease [Flavobacteriaceae bacterium]